MLVPGPQGASRDDGNGSGADSSGDTPTSDHSTSSSNSTNPFSQQANGTALAAEAAGILAASSATVSQQALAIYRQLGALQQHNNRASTFNDPQDPGLDVTKQGLADAANRIIAAAGKARRAGMRGSLAVLQMQLMLPAANSSAATRFTSRLSGFLARASWELGVRGKVGLATTVIRLLAASVLAPSLTMFPSPFPWNSQTQLRMQAVQDRQQPGKFAVSLFGFARSNNYLINKLEGDADSSYNMTTIVSCDAGQFSVSILARTPSVSQSEIDAQLSQLETQGIVLGEANIFISANQDERARAGDTYFCQELVKETVGACPDVQTSNTFMAEFFQGKWYEIGSTAESKLEVSGELGMSCVTYNFVFQGINHSLNRFSVVKRGIRMTTPARQSQIQGLSKSSLAVRDHLRAVCAAIARPPAQGSSATLQVNNAQNTLSWAELPNDVEADVKVALGDIADSMAQVSAHAERAYNLLARIQQLNAQLSQMDRVFFIWQTKQKLVSAVRQLQSESTAINKGRVSIMKSAQIATRRVNKVENKLGNLRGKQTLLLNLNDIVGLTRNISGFGRATGRMGAATASMRPMAGLMFSNPLAMRFSYSAIGAVSQVEASQVGKMQVTYGNGRGVVENMWVAGLWGNQAMSDSYSMALIYSCYVPPANIGSGRTAEISFRLLSRSPSVSQADVDSALQLLEQQGVPMGGPNPYVPTFQSVSGQKCNDSVVSSEDPRQRVPMGPGVVFPKPPSRDRPSFPIAFGAKPAADLASKPRPQHPLPTRGCDKAQRDPLLPQQQQQCTIRALDAKKPFNAPPLSIPSDVSSNLGDDASSCSSPASFPVLPLFSHHSTAKPPSASRAPARSPRPSLPRPRSPCPFDFSALSNSPRHSPGTTFGRPARPATAPDHTPPLNAAYPCDEESPRSTDNAAAPAAPMAAQQAQWFILPAQRPEVVRAAAQASRCASPDTPLGFVTSPNAASSPSSQPARPRSSLSSLPPSSPRPPIAADSAGEERGFRGDYDNLESNRLVIAGNSSRSVSSAGSVECGEPSTSSLGDSTTAAIVTKSATISARRSSESDFAAKRAAADAARPPPMGFRSVSLSGREEGRSVMEAAAQAEREFSRHRSASIPSRNLPRGAGLMAAWGGIASRAPPLAANRQEEAEEKTTARAEEVEREGDRLMVVEDVSDAVSCVPSSASDGWGGSHGGEAEQDDREGDTGEEEGGAESDWASESTMCLNLESVEQLCAQMEFQKKTIEAIQIVAVPALPQISLERPKRALSRAAAAAAGAGSSSGDSDAGSAGWPLRALSAPRSSASLMALRFSGSLTWHTPGDPELWERGSVM
ncbi:unnamed protein product [Closterium sp. Yama58-4]|nr:unnamed protein product [Closterium sp. Yama58-4]